VDIEEEDKLVEVEDRLVEVGSFVEDKQERRSRVEKEQLGMQ